MKVQVLYPIEGNYRKDDVFDVSVIIPMYKSIDVVRDQILNWPIENLKVELVYVDDCCPSKSAAAVFQSWSTRQDRNKFSVKIVLANSNNGFGGACNLGAYHSQGKNLVFLNADTIVSSNWLEPMIEHLKDESVGIVGNLQIKHGGDWDGTIDSAGSEWTWDHSNFMHIGRHIVDGFLLRKPMTPNNAPTSIMTPGEREMVTGCCFAIRKSLFNEIGGFDLRYKIGYWEDSEICMTVKELGYKIIFEPRSVIYHKLSHSDSGGHDFQNFNKCRFTNKWITSGRIDNLVKSKRKLPPTKISDIIVQREDANGDVLVATAVIPAIKKKYPNSRIIFKTNCQQMVKGNPLVHKVIDMSDNVMHQLKYDLDLVYERRPFTNILQAYADEAGVSVNECEPFLKTESIEVPDDYIVFHVCRFPGWAGRCCDVSHFDELSRRLNRTVITVGGAGDHLIPDSIDMRGKTTMGQLAYVIKNCSLFVGVDSCPMHIAQTFKVPGVAFFGSINPDTRIFRDNMFGITADPTFVKCLGCHHKKLAPATVTKKCPLDTLDCEKKLSVERMWEKIEQCLRT